MINNFSCFSCKNKNFSIKQSYKYIQSSHFSKLFKNLEIYKCKKCGIAQINHELIDKNKLLNYYKEFYRSIDEFVEIKSDSDNKYFYERAKGQINLIKKYKLKKNLNNILEIGPGSGHLLIELKKQYPQVELFIDELDKKLNKKLLNIVNIDKNKNQYDVVILSHVLEHLLYPNKYLINIHSKLKNKGLIVIEVPRQENIDSYSYTEPHLSFFSIKSMKNLIKNNLSDYYNILSITTVGGYQDTAYAQKHRIKKMKILSKIKIYIMKFPLFYSFLRYIKNKIINKKPKERIPNFDFSNDSELDIYNMIHLVIQKK
tara:strand:- start:310 stop:1254 length:945 start_codon:yes stop_codon:yes gene_type:complete